MFWPPLLVFIAALTALAVEWALFGDGLFRYGRKMYAAFFGLLGLVAALAVLAAAGWGLLP